ncbi:MULTISPECIES: apiosidase-like domain-containing protein [Olivibacter]|uniref:DUF4038 domain-containing protein n=1 Tax=Olivibacter jilunii TaxID=985016 RepID=A0ABW6B6J9_9SPHI|nr:DUF4038 domain-containing protein [Pseudosphingobacterium sp.]
MRKAFLSYARFVIWIMLFPLFVGGTTKTQQSVAKWTTFEQSFHSNKQYGNPLYEVGVFEITFTSPSGREKTVDGFWNGASDWLVRFMPDETGRWKWTSRCSDSTNMGLHKQEGQFNCVANDQSNELLRHGRVLHNKGTYYLSHADGKPFFWGGCTAWNGPLKSTEAEWKDYLAHRALNGYNLIQFVATQWRGCDKNSLGQVAFEGSGYIAIKPEFFKHLDQKIDEINAHGLVAAPVLLWALATVQGRELSPGYYLPDEEAILLAKYLVARYGGHHVVWILGGDGNYVDENEGRWKRIGRAVFAGKHEAPVALHPGGRSWIGDAYNGEDWLDIIGYQSGHDNSLGSVNFINRGPITNRWAQLAPRPIINMEPLYEESQRNIQPLDIRNASYWSLFNAPTAGISYGTTGLWSWLRVGEKVLNHGFAGAEASRWRAAMSLPGSIQVGYLIRLMQGLPWWELRPAAELLAKESVSADLSDYVSVTQTRNRETIVVYLPRVRKVVLNNVNGNSYRATWFSPATNRWVKGSLVHKETLLELNPPPSDQDMVIVLENKKSIL